jgi:spiro-SPASM protein
MKNLVIMYAGDAGSYAHKNILSENAISRSLNWAKQISDVCFIEMVKEKHTISEILTLALALLQEKQADTLIFARAECPFYSSTITEELLLTHNKYASEYTFADGFPYGIAPEIVNIGTVKVLLSLLEKKTDLCSKTLSKNGIFELIQTDINSFEIETILSKKDYRALRLDFSCDTKRNFLTCKNLVEAMVKRESTKEIKSFDASNCNVYALCDTAELSVTVLRTLPAFYEIQVVGGYENPTIYDVPKSIWSEKIDTNNNIMPYEKFEKLINDIASFSEDAVISLSLYGDPLTHPQFIKMIKTVLKYSSLSLLIETDGTILTMDLASEISTIVTNFGVRKNNQFPINWIIRIDSVNAEMYSKIHCIEDLSIADKLLKTAQNSVKILKNFFPGAVYPQFVRMNDNEEQLEDFYRSWKKDQTGELIIQKYDSITGLLKDRRVADLEPLDRNTCWHLRRDMCILVDGMVPICREALFAQKVDKNQFPNCGNVFIDSLDTIFQNGNLAFQSHVDKKYCTQCKVCDEYYTFNF